MKPVLGKELVRTLNAKHGYFQYADAQGDVSVAFANEAVELFLGLSVEATKAYEATGLTPSQLQARVAELEAALAAEREACAAICDEMAEHWSAYKDSALLNGDVELSNTASGEPRAAAALASLIRGRA